MKVPVNRNVQCCQKRQIFAKAIFTFYVSGHIRVNGYTFIG